jgi:hypothetical protein
MAYTPSGPGSAENGGDCRKLRVLPAAVLQRRLQLSPEHASLLEPADAPRATFERLLEHKLHAEAARFLAYALPVREAVWWAAMCIYHTAPAALPEAERTALTAAEAWVRKPDDLTRRNAAWAAAAAGYHTPGAWPALAAYWSRLALPDDMRGGRGVETAVSLALARSAEGDGEAERRRARRLASFIASGRDVASGGAGRLPGASG